MSNTHPEPAEIAALDAELLPPDEAAALRDHLAACADCAAILADLHALSDELNAIPSPPIPADVAARIDAALMAEAAATTVSRETRSIPPRRWPRMALAAAAALIAVGLGGALIRSVDLDSANDAGGGSASRDLAAAEAGDPLAEKVQRLLGGAADDATALESQSDGDAQAPDEANGQQLELDAVSLPSCVRTAIDRTEEPLASAEERFQGQDAYVVVLPHPGDPDRVNAYAVAADCAARRPATAGEILDQGTYPRQP
jgi:hypothetical protein